MPRDPMTHDLKIHPQPFAEARAGRKRYEIRRDDRDFQVDDLVRLQEWDPARGYTGEELPVQPVTCITRNGEACWGLLDGYVVLGLGYGPTDILPQLLDLQAEVKRRRQDAERWGAFIVALGSVLDVAETQDFLGAGYVEDDLLASARRLAALAGTEASGRLRRALDLVQEAADSWLMGSGSRAKDKAAAAGVPFLFKQWGEWVGAEYDSAKGKVICQKVFQLEAGCGRVFWTNPGHPEVKVWGPRDHYWDHASAKVGKKAAGRLLDGVEHNGYPEVG